MSSVYRVGHNAQPSDIDGAPGWYWQDETGATHGPYSKREDAQAAEAKLSREQIEGMDSTLGALS